MICVHRQGKYGTHADVKFFPSMTVTTELVTHLMQCAGHTVEVYDLGTNGQEATLIYPAPQENPGEAGND